MTEFLEKLRYNPKRQSISIIGATQTGKTTHAISISSMLANNNRNILILDNKRKFTGLNPSRVIHTLSDIRGQGLEILQPYKFDSPVQMQQFFVDLCYVMYSMKNQIFVMDELQSWFRNKWVSIPSLELFAHECHNQNCSFIAIFQAPSEVPNYILRNSEHRFCLFLDLPTDIDYIKRFMGKEVLEFMTDSYLRENYIGFYKQQGQLTKKFRVVKLD